MFLHKHILATCAAICPMQQNAIVSLCTIISSTALRIYLCTDHAHNTQRYGWHRFNYYMFNKGHTGMIKVKRATEEKPGTLEIKVRIGGNGSKSGNVKDLKQLSGTP